MLQNPGLLAGSVTLIAFFALEKVYDKDRLMSSAHKHILLIVPYVLFTLISLLFYLNVGNSKDIYIGTSFLLFTGLLFSAIYFKDKVPIINVSFKKGIFIGLATGIIGVFLVGENYNIYNQSLAFIILWSITFLVPCIILPILFLQNKKDWYQVKDSLREWNISAVLFQLICFLTYATLLRFLKIPLDGPFMTILLVAHAIVLLFIALRTQNNVLNKASLFLGIIGLIKVVFHDIKDFSGTNKVIVLIVIGAILLASSYAYVKLKKSFDDRDKEPG